METIGQKILKLRKEKHLSQEELSFELGVSRLSIHKWENDLMQPNLESIKLLCSYFKVDSNYFINDRSVVSQEVLLDSLESAKFESKELAITDDSLKQKANKKKIFAFRTLEIISIILSLLFITIAAIYSAIVFTDNTGYADVKSTFFNELILAINLVLGIVFFVVFIFVLIYIRRLKSKL